MRLLVLGLLLGLAAGYGAALLSEEGNSGGRGGRRDAADAPDIVLQDGSDDGELKRLRDLVAKLRAELDSARAQAAPETAPYPVPTTEEGIALLQKEFEETGDLDRLLALIEALLLQGEAGYPRLTRLLVRVGMMAMSNRVEEAEAMKRVVPAFHMAMRHERKLVGYVGYLITSDKVPSLMKTPALGAAMFLSMNGVEGSEEFGPQLLDAFMKQSEEGGTGGLFGREEGRMLIEAMGMLRQKEAVQPLLRMLRDPKQQGQSSRIVEALGRIGDPSAVGPLVQRLKDDTDPNNWWQPEVRALARIGTAEAKAAAESHIRALENDNHFFAQAGLYLQEQPTETMFALVRERFRKNPQAHNMWATVRALQQIDSPESRLLLEEISRESTNEHVRTYAARQLAELAAMRQGLDEMVDPSED